MTKIYITTVFLFLSGCTMVSPLKPHDTSHSIVKTSEQIQETYWKLVELRGKAVVLNEKEREPYIVLKVQNNRIHGFAGCNLLMGSYELEEGGRIRFSKIASTMMACPQMEEEQVLFHVLEEVEHYSIGEGILTFTKARMAPLAKFKAIH